MTIYKFGHRQPSAKYIQLTPRYDFTNDSEALKYGLKTWGDELCYITKLEQGIKTVVSVVYVREDQVHLFDYTPTKFIIGKWDYSNKKRKKHVITFTP